MFKPERTPLSDHTMLVMGSDRMARLISSRWFAAFDGRILVTGFACMGDLLNSHEGTGVLSAVDSANNLVRTMFNLREICPANNRDCTVLRPTPPIRIEFRESLLDSEGDLLFGSAGFRLPTIWIHRGHGGYDENGDIGISAGLDADRMLSTELVSDAIRACSGMMLLAILPVCTSKPSAHILRRNRRVAMVEGNDMTFISCTQSEDRLLGLDQLRELMYTPRWYSMVLHHLGFTAGD